MTNGRGYVDSNDLFYICEADIGDGKMCRYKVNLEQTLEMLDVKNKLYYIDYLNPMDLRFNQKAIIEQSEIMEKIKGSLLASNIERYAIDQLERDSPLQFADGADETVSNAPDETDSNAPDETDSNADTDTTNGTVGSMDGKVNSTRTDSIKSNEMISIADTVSTGPKNSNYSTALVASDQTKVLQGVVGVYTYLSII